MPSVRGGGPGIPKVITDRFAGSVHGKLKCTDCHQNISQVPHKNPRIQVGCVQCHQSMLEDARDAGKDEHRGIRQARNRDGEDQQLPAFDPCAAQQCRSVAHQRHLL